MVLAASYDMDGLRSRLDSSKLLLSPAAQDPSEGLVYWPRQINPDRHAYGDTSGRQGGPNRAAVGVRCFGLKWGQLATVHVVGKQGSQDLL